MEPREYRPFLGCVEEARWHARVWPIAFICGFVIPFGLIFIAVSWVKGVLDYRAIVWGVISAVLLSAAGYAWVEILIRAISTSLTLSKDGLVYQTTWTRRDGVRTLTRIQSPWSEIRAVRERLSWWGGRALRLEVDTEQGSFSFRTTFASHDELKRTIRSLAPNLSEDDWGDALPGFGSGNTFREYPEWRSWLIVAPILVLVVVELVWGGKQLYNSGLPPELRDPTPPKWLLGLMLISQWSVLLVLLTPVAVWLRNYLNVAHDGIRREQCRMQWMPPRIHSTRTRVRWSEIMDIRWIDGSHRGLRFDTTHGEIQFGEHLSETTNHAILQEIRRHAPSLGTAA